MLILIPLCRLGLGSFLSRSHPNVVSYLSLPFAVSKRGDSQDSQRITEEDKKVSLACSSLMLSLKPLLPLCSRDRLLRVACLGWLLAPDPVLPLTEMRGVRQGARLRQEDRQLDGYGL
jgi:hypothetical protein